MTESVGQFKETHCALCGGKITRADALYPNLDVVAIPLVADYSMYVIGRGVVLPHYLCLTSQTRRVKLAYMVNLVLRKLCRLWSGSALPTLRKHILCIVLRRAKKKMIWIAARWIITAVANELAPRDGAVCESPCFAMGRNTLAILCGLPIAIGLPTACPGPASIGTPALVNIRPKGFRLYCFGVMPLAESYGLALDRTPSSIGLLSDWSRLATAALTQPGRIKRQLDSRIRGWYTGHVIGLLYRLITVPRPVSAGAGVFYA